MRWSELLEAVGSEPVFESGMLLVGPVDRGDVYRQLTRWTKAGRLIQLRRGVYAFAGPDARRLRPPHPYEVANRLVPGSYVSLSSVLADVGVIPEYVPVTTSVTTVRPGRFVTPLGTFTYRHVKPALFWGIETVDVEGGGRAHVALPEKALIDLLYLHPDADDPAYLSELRLQNLDRLRLDVLATMAARAGVPRVARAVERITGLAALERDEYRPWTLKARGSNP
ncbi:MAG: hypothetical protein ABFC80_05835 [Coriobacteriales bacterium]